MTQDQTQAGESVTEFMARYAIGTEKIQLAGEGNGLMKLERVVRCEGGVEHYYHEDIRDWLDVPGHWVVVETLATGFKHSNEARDFMIAREANVA